MEKGELVKDPLPENFSSLEEAADFWDTHSIADYEEYFHDVDDVEVDLKSRHAYLPVAFDLEGQTRDIAHRQGMPLETLVNAWLSEKIQEYRLKHQSDPVAA